jgi:DNA-directed RNA polymerase subunit B'
MSEVFLNGKFVGTIDNAEDFVKQVKAERRKGVLPDTTNIFYNDRIDEVRIECLRGRVRRPLILVKEGASLLTEKHIRQLQKNEIGWKDLVDNGIIEYLDAMEEENALVAFVPEELTLEHTHLDITPLAMVGLTTSLVPFGNFNQSTRLNAGSKNQKQAIGFYAANFDIRMDMDVNLLHNPQVPIVQSVMHDISEYQKHPAGQNLVVAVMSYKGHG